MTNNIITFTAYIVIGLLLVSMGFGIETWEWWAVTGCVLIVDMSSFLKGVSK